MVPGRGEVLTLIATLVAAQASIRPSVLDLGCGLGDVTMAILERTPDATATLVDLSAEMLKRAGERFADDGRVRLLEHDLNLGLPRALAGSQFDAVVSCFTFHHVEPENRVTLYEQIRGVLRPGGLFINGDRVRGESPSMGTWEFDHWIDWMTARARKQYGSSRTAAEIRQRQLEMDHELGDKPASIWAMRDGLKQAGFAHVDCLYKNQITAVIVALNQDE